MNIQDEDKGMTMAFQVVDVHRSLLLVSRVCSQGHDVVSSDKKWIFIDVNGDPRNAIPIRKTGGIYELDVWLKPGPNNLDVHRPGR